MKRFVCLGLVFALGLSICSCTIKGGNDTSKADTSKDVQITKPEQTEVALLDLLSTLTLENYPVVDGSTATIPLAIGLISKMTGCTDAQAEESIAFNTTDASYY